MRRLLNDYFLVLEPSHSGYCFPDILQYLSYEDEDIIVQATEESDLSFLKRLGRNLIPVDFGASDWIDDRVFRPLGLKKEFDCVMVAMWNDVKRHHVLMATVQTMNDPTYRVALAGGAWNRTLRDMQKMAKYYGVNRNITFFEALPQREVNELLNRSKVNVLLSLREGSNKSIFEGFFADVPGLVLSNNLGVNKQYINDETGRLATERELAGQLAWFRTGYRQFGPRAWAERNISCPRTTAKLQTALELISRKKGLPWTRPLATKVNRGSYQEYYHSQETLPPLDLEKYRRQ